MIFKCRHCEHLFEQEDPAYGWEKNYYLQTCPHCKISLNSPLAEIRLLNGLAVTQFLAMVWAGSHLLFGRQEMAEFFTWLLIAMTMILFFANNRKGKPVLRYPHKSS